MNTAPFLYNKNKFGGTEYMGEFFKNNILPICPNFNKYQCYIIPGIMPTKETLIKDNREVIIWLHNLLCQLDEEVYKQLKTIKNKIKNIIVVSNYHKHKLIHELDVDPKKIIVIENTTDFPEYNKEKFNNLKKIKLIHASASYRGTELLIHSVKHIKEDFVLNIYNDFDPYTLYGKNFVLDSRINLHGIKKKSEVIKEFSKSHIHVYPSIFEETSCITQIEALSAGCLSVYSNYGALCETSLGFGINYNIPDILNLSEHSLIFAENLMIALDLIKNKNFNPDNQVEKITKKYSNDFIIKKWLDFHNLL